MMRVSEAHYRAITTLLCDADGNLFPSEEPAYVASARVVNRFMQAFGVDREYTPEELRRGTTGKNFRMTVVDLAVACGVPLAPDLAFRYPSEAAGDPRSGRRALTANDLERWVAEEQREVTSHLRKSLRPDPAVTGPLTALSERFTLAAVSSSALRRLAVCFSVCALDALFPVGRRFSAEDSLPRPTSKPNPAIYRFAGERLGITAEQGLAVEDSVPGAQAAVTAGFRTVGNVCYVSLDERPERIRALEAIGVETTVTSWQELATRLGGE